MRNAALVTTIAGFLVIATGGEHVVARLRDDRALQPVLSRSDVGTASEVSRYDPLPIRDLVLVDHQAGRRGDRLDASHPSRRPTPTAGPS
jgi:hypothetical protein